MSSTPLPPHGEFISAVRKSCHEIRVKNGIEISDASVKRLLLSPAFTSTYQRISSTLHGLALPLQFPSALAELNFLSVLSLLNVGSGYRVMLHQQVGRGAWDSIRAFAFGLYLTSSSGNSDLLSAKGMSVIDEGRIAELLGVKIHEEKPHASIPGLTVGEVGGLGWELVKILKQLLNETGTILVSNGYQDLGSFVAEALKEGERVSKMNSSDAVAETALEHLVKAFPGFQDMATVNNTSVYCFKKALFLLNGVSIRFSSRSTPPFPIPKTSELPIFTDNVIPSILIHLGVIDLSACDPALAHIFPSAGSPETLESLLASAPVEVADTETRPSKTIPKESPVLTEEQAYILRAAAIDACECMVRVARSLDAAEIRVAGASLEWINKITLPDLDAWLWAVAKDRTDYRQLDRFVLRNTPFF